MAKKIVWFLLAIATVIILFLVVGTSQSPKSTSSQESSKETKIVSYSRDPLVEETSLTTRILIIGDSIGFGIGDEEGLGIGERYRALLSEKENVEINLNNISVPGYQSDELVEAIQNQDSQALIQDAELIIISIGGNDLSRLQFQENLEVAFEETLAIYIENIDLVISRINQLNPAATIAFVGLYNPDRSQEAIITSSLSKWNNETQSFLNRKSGVVYIPTDEIFSDDLENYLSADGFHPSGAGYQAIAELLDDVLDEMDGS